MINRSRALRWVLSTFYPEISTPRALSGPLLKHMHPSVIYRHLAKVRDCADFTAIQTLEPDTHHAGRLGRQTFACIVETRDHPVLAWCIKNVRTLSGLPVQLFHGTSNLDTVLGDPELRAMLEAGDLLLTPLGIEGLNARSYNAMFLSPRFWHAMAGRGKILFFQTDALLCQGSEFTLKDFIGFDYIGAWWHRVRPSGMILDGGNGGISIRDWALCMRSLEAFPPEFWNGGEDGYFAFHVDYLGGNVGREEDMKRFATQRVFAYRSFGAHHITELRNQNPVAFERFLAYCPDAVRMLR